MFERIKEVLKEFAFLNPLDLALIAGVVRFKKVAKGEHVIREGDFCYLTIRVVSGLLCQYVIDHNGFERILVFVPEMNDAGSVQTILNQQASDENVVALEDSVLLVADFRDLDRLAGENHRILKLLNQGFKQKLSEAAARINFLIVYSPEERYLHFCKTYPMLESRLRQKDIASYLGITVSSLSRIRARISKK